jgi:protein-glutamine gamma-glutamyltransferase
MNFDRYFITSSYALLAISFVMLAATSQVDGISVALFGGVLIAGWLIDNGKLRAIVTQRMANWLLVGFLPVLFIEWQLIELFPARVIIHFIIFASSLKLLREKTDRDWLWLYIVSFCQVLMSAGMMIGTSYLVLLIFYLFAAISTFVSYEIRRSRQVFLANQKVQNQAGKVSEIEFWKEDQDSRQEFAQPRWRSLSYFSALILALILLIAVPIFLTMPRLTRGFARNGLLATERLSGFSDTVRLGEVAQVKLNPQVVMRVRVRLPNDAQREQLRWRGVTLDNYDGRSWSESGASPVQIKKFADSFKVDEKLSRRGVTQQHFFVEPLNINTVFAAPRPIFVTGLPELWRDSGDGLWTEHHAFHKLDYVVYSDTSIPTDAQLSADNSRVYPPEIRQRYLHLQADRDREIDNLSAEVTRGAITQLEIARRIEHHLRTNYSYTLNLQRVDYGDPVADFLFNVRAGHCEYFASAMVLMLRSRRVPARLVNGFQMGEYNDSADFYTVRQSDAHSWVEAFFPKYGWIAFDPTPPAGLSVYSDGWGAWLRHYVEAVEMFWLEHVVGFDTGKQILMARAMQRWLTSYQSNPSLQWMDWAAELTRNIESWMGRGFAPSGNVREPGQSSQSSPPSINLPFALSLVFSTLLLLAAAIWYQRRNSWMRRLKDDTSSSAIAFYEEMLKALERAGYRRESHQTPTEFAARVARPGVWEITHLYQRTRFGNEGLTDDDVARISVLLGEMKKGIL